ncbi:MAG TPA: FtsX-like permease family protein [Chlamydiales bacterium]|nr:FtsX-like permease family protein [Chlamydiales bacterium]
MSVVVISLVVWLVLVFLSVTAGIEKNWLKKITSLHAPLRISPTPEYYHSYYYQVDAHSSRSNYSLKTIGEKAESPLFDPYSDETDYELPSNLHRDNIDPVKELYDILEKEKLTFQDYEISGAFLQLRLKNSGSMISQMSFLLSLPDKNPNLSSLLIPDEKYAHFEKGKLILPDVGLETFAILPKNYREHGIECGDKGTFSFAAFTASSMQEQKIHFRVVGFYDPGVMSVGNKCILVPKELTRTIHASTQTFSPDGTPTNGVFVWIDDLSKAKHLQEELTKKISQAGLGKYWKVTSYEDFEFAKDLLHQFRSDRTLLLIVASIILIVACCNIISLLVLLVNDKKKEIAILQSMGASFKSIAIIFSSCGAIMGTLSGMIGSLLATFTLHHINSLVAALSYLQGRTAFNPAFFGQTLPDSLSMEALTFVLLITPLISLIAGLIPAIKASRIRPSLALRAE